MKNYFTFKISGLFIILFTIVLNYSCSEKFFEEPAGERILPENHYNSMQDAQMSIYGIVALLQDVAPNLILTDGLRSDQMDITKNADIYQRMINEHNYSADNPYLDPSTYYKVIISINEVLKNIDKVAKIDRNFDAYSLRFAKGALIGFRTWAYFTLVRLYGEAALINDNMTTLPETLNQNFLNKETMIDTLINQLTPFIHTDEKLVEIMYLNYINPKAVLGELYLEKGDYQKAAEYLKKALESQGSVVVLYIQDNTLSKSTVTGLYKVDNVYTKESWKDIFINSEQKYYEVLSAVPFSFTEGHPNPLSEWLAYTGSYMVKPTSIVTSLFQAQMPKKGKIPGDAFRGLGISYDTIPGGETYISKYLMDKSQPYSGNIILSRAADLHLLLAEALNRMNDTTTAMVLLNDGFAAQSSKPAEFYKWSKNAGIRGRAYVSNVTIPIDAPDPIIAVEDLIMQERSMELAFEGKRWFDLVRIAKRRNNPAYLADKVAAKFSDPAVAGQVKSKLMDPNNWYLPFKK